MTTITIGKVKKPLAILVVAEYIQEKFPVTLSEGNETSFSLGSDGVNISNWATICRMLVRAAPDSNLYGETALQRTEVDHWLELSRGRLSCTKEFLAALEYLNHKLTGSTYLIGKSATLADIAVWSTLRGSAEFASVYKENKCPANVKRYFEMLCNLKHFRTVDTGNPGAVTVPKGGAKKAPAAKKPQAAGEQKKVMKEEGKFIELPGAEMGKVVVRFPPEASGFLHVGHAKAALLNQYYQQNFNGKLIMRFDDTNPAKEDADFEKVILEDITKLGIKPDVFTHTSDLFDKMLVYAEKFIRDGKAYVDNTDPETMKKEREERVESANRANSVEKNLSMWGAMQAGSTEGQKCALRAKLDMKSDNGCMRDPTIYRCKTEPHIRTGTKYKVYPTYDFACPIVDSLEGVTHALRTTEYHDRDDQYYWFIEAMGLRKPYIWEYSRLNLQNTVMSKRKLTWFVEQGLVDGWDDPRLPTVRGVLRRGMTVQGLKEFVIAQGSSRSVNMMEWDKIWAVNKKVIDPVVPRFTALEKAGIVMVNVVGVKDEVKQAQKHPKDPAVGMKDVYYSGSTYIEGADAECLKVGEKVTFINWGNLIIKSINKNASGGIESIDAESALEDRDYKKTAKVTWLAANAPCVPAVCVLFEHIITKGVLSKEEDFKQYINNNSRSEQVMLGDPELANLKKGDIIQLQRRGYYICDSAYEPPSPYTSRASPCILLNIPDGHTKEMPTSGSKHSEASVSKKEAAQNKKGKQAEKSPQEETAPSAVGGNDAASINQKIIDQGNLVRQLKAEKAGKDKVKAAVDMLLSLKTEYKQVAGEEWKPGCTPPAPAPAPAAAAAPGGDAVAINGKIIAQGDKIRDLKSAKADKSAITAEVNVLLALKAEYKKVAGTEWKPGCTPPAPAAAAPLAAPGGDAAAIHSQIAAQGDKIRDLKSAKTDKNTITAEVNVLLDLKIEYKKVAGVDWRPGCTPPAPASSAINDNIVAQGDKIRELKSAKADKSVITAEVNVLLALKEEFKKMTGVAWTPWCTPSASKAAAPPAAPAASGDSGSILDQQITAQGNKIRDLKAAKAAKDQIKAEVDKLLALKGEYKKATGAEWKPGPAPAAAAPMASAPAASAPASPEVTDLDNKITQQGNKIRDLKEARASKKDLKPEIDALLALKAEYKKVAGKDWKPGSAAPAAAAPAPAPANSSADKLNAAITEQGNLVRKLKGEKAPKPDIDAAVKILVSLKGDYKASTGSEWKPVQTPAQQAPAAAASDKMDAAGLKAKIDEQGAKVRQLKSSKADKGDIEAAVKTLLDLKAQYKELTGEEPAATGGRQQQKKQDKQSKQKQPQQQQSGKAPAQPAAEGGREVKKVTRLGLEAKKEENLSDWYSQVITKGELIEYYDVSGCYVFRPWSFGIWERISAWFDAAIKRMGFENCYFPIFVSQAALEKEKEHIEDFAPEVAWVTRSGESDLAEPIAIRPTSETVMYPSYSKWVQSHRDLPIKLNQWCSVVRWEFKHPQPFLRTREFLWQEGHSAYSTYKEAEKEVYQIIDLYEEIYESLLAIPVVKGRKTDKEKFAGGDFTTTVEAYISASGRGIQAATSHHLGQNFSKMFDISFEDPETKEKQYAYQNSWAITTRSIGVIIMVHGDNKGLVLPPRIAQYQVVVVPCGITATLSEADRQKLYSRCDELVEELRGEDIRVKPDYRDNYSPGWKFNHWELKGVPVRIELGPKDLEKKQLVAVTRYDGQKQTFSLDGAGKSIKQLLEDTHTAMFSKAKKDLDEATAICYSFPDFCSALDKKKVILAPFCGAPSCEEKVKKDSARDAVVEEGAPAMGAKGLCIPFIQPKDITPQDKCITEGCNKKPNHYTLFGRSY